MMRSFVRSIKKGMIVLWSGSVASIPGGWALCNGSGDTPDLRNNFVVGAGDTYAVDGVGGTGSHSHSANETHSHSIGVGSDISEGSSFAANTDAPGKPGMTGIEDNLPPYYSLAYIMKL